VDFTLNNEDMFLTESYDPRRVLGSKEVGSMHFIKDESGKGITGYGAILVFVSVLVALAAH
jgi:hypothetical protein